MKWLANENGSLRRAALLASLLLVLAGPGCRTLPPLPAADLSQPGWTVRQGQAVWRSGRERPEIAGELLLATQSNGTAFIQFTKTPFPLVVAQQATNHWQIHFPTENKRYSGLGKPPTRLIWLWLPQALSDRLSSKEWSWHQDGKVWHLENRATGEWLEGYFAESTTTTP